MFKRVHDTGTEALLSQQPDGWRIQINLREANGNPMTITGYKAPSLELAKDLAEEVVLRRGHVCNGSCKDWEEF